MASNERYYTSAGDIYSVLRTLQTDRSAINVQFEESSAPYSSMVLDVDLRRRVFQLDEFANSVAQKRAEEGSPFSIRASINGIRVHAKDLKIKRIGEDSRGKFYELDFPERMLYLQRRDAFRAWVPGTLMLKASLTGVQRDVQYTARLQNMSATGFRVVIDGRVTPEFEMMEEMDVSIALTLIDYNLDCRAEVVYAQYSQDSNHTVCGLRFSDISRASQIAVNRFVTQLQRESIIP